MQCVVLKHYCHKNCVGCQHSLVSCCEVDPGCFLAQVQSQDLKGELIPGRHQLIQNSGFSYQEGIGWVCTGQAGIRGWLPAPSMTSSSQTCPSPSNSNDSKTCMWSRNIKSRTCVPEEMQTEACFVSNCRGVLSQLRVQLIFVTGACETPSPLPVKGDPREGQVT